MPQEQERFQEAVNGMLEALMFENWLRFYFLQEEKRPGADEPVLRVIIPEPAMQRIRDRFTAYVPMAERMNGREATLELSRDAVCDFIRTTYEGTLIPRGSVASYFDSHAFQVGMQLFNVWVQAYEELLDATFHDFARWCEAFRTWRASEHGREVENRMEEDAARAFAAAGDGRVGNA